MPPLAFCLSVLRSAAPLLALALGAACASTPIFEPTSYPARSEHLSPFAAERVRPHPGALSGDVRDARPPERREHLNAHLASSPGQATAYLWWSLYGATYSRANGPTCNFAPSCSRFGLEAVSGGPLGFIWTFGRLQRDQRPDAFYASDARGALLDPVEAYTVWGDDPTLDRSPYAETPHHGWYLFVQAQRSGLAGDLLRRHADDAPAAADHKPGQR